MGEHEGWAQPNLPLPNGLLPDEGASVIRVLDSERWLKAEERIAELIARIQPNQPSEERRNAVAYYVQRLIMKSFPCQVFRFGSVPLKTYLPDGDIDLTAFSNNQGLKDTWASQVRDMLENEEKNENAEFQVKEVQYIQAEVKIIKCLVENIVVDISFNQLGGLCTLCFLEEVDHLIDKNHLFKCSIILIKAWCYYESRILGAHHGLISTYALETLVLYIFHVFNNSFTGPLEVLFRFLEFFSNFDWDNFCVSLWGPVPISSLPDVTAEPPRKDSGELLLSKLFLDACSSVYAVFPVGQDNQGQPFISKHFNVIDPLRVNNNLGRSVSKGNFFRIRSAFAFGAKRLAQLLDCPKERLVFEVNQFFMNTWDRHGSGCRPDAPETDFSDLSLLNLEPQQGSKNARCNSSVKKLNQQSQGHETEYHGSHGSVNILSQPGHIPPKSTSRRANVPTFMHMQNKLSHSNAINSSDRIPTSSQPENPMNDLHGRCIIARTRSSPELTDTYGGVSFRGRHNRTLETGKNHISLARLENRSVMSATGDPSSLRQILTPQNHDSDTDSVSPSNNYHNALGLGAIGEDAPSIKGTQGMMMLQEAQDIVNMSASSAAHGFNGQVHVPLNLASAHAPFPISLVSMGYGQRNMAGVAPSSIPLLDPSWVSNFQFSQGLIPSPLTHFFPGAGLASNTENSAESGCENFSSMDSNPRDTNHDFWHDQDRSSPNGFGPDNGNSDFTSPSFAGSSGSSLRPQQKLMNEGQGSTRNQYADSFYYEDDRESEAYYNDKNGSSRFLPHIHARSMRSPKSTREKRGRKTSPSMVPSVSTQADMENRDWSSFDIGDQSADSLHVTRRQMPGFESTSGADPPVPITHVLLHPGSRHRPVDNSNVVPFTFYPTGPPVPFLTMLPVYNLQRDTETADHFGDEEGVEDSDPGQNLCAIEGIDRSGDLNASTSVVPAERKADILNGDFARHWQNLQFGRYCQNPGVHHQPLVYPSPVAVPSMYLQGHLPWDGHGRSVSANMNVAHFMGHDPGFAPLASLQSVVPNRSAGVYQCYADEIPKYRSGTGTYLPNPKAASVRDRHALNSRRGSYNSDRTDHQTDREGNWNGNAKSRAIGRIHGRGQNERHATRTDRPAAGTESRPDRLWGPYRHDPFPAYPQNGPFAAHVSSGGSSSNGPAIPPVVMLYPYDHGCGSSAEPLEFGSVGSVGVAGMKEASQLDDGPHRQERPRFYGSSVQQQASSPRVRR